MINQDQVSILDKAFVKHTSKEEIDDIVENLSDQINSDYQNESVVIIAVLDGVILFLADLIRKLDIDLTLELVKLKSYSGTQSTGKVEQLIGTTKSLKGKHVLIVEDIIDTGNTLTYLLDLIRTKNPKSIQIATLLLKEEVFGEKFPIKYVGKKIENKFVVGYGMDFDDQGRQLSEIYVAIE